MLPTGTVTLLIADVEGSTRLWEEQPSEMTAAVAQLERTMSAVAAAHCGARPAEQRDGDSFLVVFGRASDAVACALELQCTPLDPIRLRIGVHTGELQRPEDAESIGPTVNRTARLCDLAHGGQTVLSGTTSDLVIDRLPADAWLTDLGVHALRDLARPERVVQLCHKDSCNEFPPLRTPNAVFSQNLPAQLTTFVGRQAEMEELHRIVRDNRLITLTGTGGVGKTRLALEVASQLIGEFADGVWYVDLSPVTLPVVVPVTVARTLGLPDQPGRSTTDTLRKFIGDRKMLLVLDSCEHLLDACGALIVALLDACPHLTVLANSRELTGVAGELTWTVPSLSLADEAIELFADRARRTRPEFRVTEENSAIIANICLRLDGIPLAIELAAARVRALSLTQIIDNLHDRFRLLTGGARTALHRHQTLRASVDWSYALLTEPERRLFRRLSVFSGGFDLDATREVGASSAAEQYDVINPLSQLVDKSLVLAEDVSGAMRYRLLETVREYAMEKLDESGEADVVRCRHRDYYTGRAADLVSSMPSGRRRLTDWADVEIDNLRAAFAWSCENDDFESALRLVSALQPFWIARARLWEGLALFSAALPDAPGPGLDPSIWARAVACQSCLAGWLDAPARLDQAREALSIARQLDDPALIAATLNACAALVVYELPETSRVYLDEAATLAHASDDRPTLCETRLYQAIGGGMWGDPVSARAAAEECQALADALGDPFMSWCSRIWLGNALHLLGDLDEACRVLVPLVEEKAATEELFMGFFANIMLARARAYQGRPGPARACGEAALAASTAMGDFQEDIVYAVLAEIALAGGDGLAAKEACEASRRHAVPERMLFIRNPMPEALHACGELKAARQWADSNLGVPGSYEMVALIARAYIALAQGESDQAERDAHDALVIAARTHGFLHLPDIVDCLGRLAADEGSYQNAAHLFGAADAIRGQIGVVRFPMYQADYDAAVESGRAALGEGAFDAAWSGGAALSIEETIAFAQRGRGKRRRPSFGWESLTPTEKHVVQLVHSGLANKDIANRMIMSPRTVSTHLTHIYIKLGVSSRVQLVGEAARHF